MAIEGKVAALLNDRELVINKGEESGVKPGMIFGVLETRPEIKDPDTGEIIGSVDSIKIRVKVVQVQPKLCVCRTYETYQINVGGTGQSWLFGALGTPPKLETRVKTLKMSDAPFDSLEENGSFVRTGDRVRQLEQE